MSFEVSYREYVADDYSMSSYLQYQQRYASDIRESDKVLISLIEEALHVSSAPRPKFSLLDLGCSTGNLLRHLRARFPAANLIGGDASVPAIEQCRRDESLQGMRFEVMDALNLGTHDHFDFVISNAMTYLFESDEYEQVIRQIHRALKPGGWYLAFEWIHPFQQEIRIVEKSERFPYGHPIHARSEFAVTSALTTAGFDKIKIQPFELPMDLNREDNVPRRTDQPHELGTYTLRTECGKRLAFRGALYQPWSHLKARKLASE